MERRKKNWGTLAYALKAGTRQHPLHRSSPNLPTNSQSYFNDDLFDDDDEYGFLPKPPPPIPAPPRPRTPLEFNEDYQRKVKEYQNKLYWESIKHKLTQYYNHRHESSANSHQRRATTARSSVNKPAMETHTKFSQPKQPTKTPSASQSVPVQSSSVLDGELRRTRRDSGSTIDLLETVNDLQETCARLEDFDDEEEECSEKHSRLCVKCLVKYYNTRQDIGVGGCERSVASAMSRVSVDT